MYNQSKKDEEFLLKKIQIEDEKNHFVGFLEYTNLNFACYNIFESKNYIDGRNDFYTASLIRLYMNNKFNENIFAVHRSFCATIISDSEKIINRYLELEDSFLDTFSSAFCKAVQSAIKNDNLGLIEYIDKLKIHTQKKTVGENYSGVINGFKGVLENDKTLIEQGIKEILEKHNKQEHPAVVNDFINLEALMFAKIAYRKGIVIEVDNPLLPTNMFQINELGKYESYDFLNEIL